MGKLGFLKKKELGLPMWAWAIIVSIVLLLLYRHFKNSSGSTAASTAAAQQAPPADVAIPSGSGDTGGGAGGATDNSQQLSDLANAISQETQGINDLLSTFQTPIDTGTTDTGTGTTDTGGSGTNTSGTTSSSSTPNGVEWGGQTMTTRAQWNAWLKARGEGWKTYKLKYPEAYAEYLTLPAGKAAGQKSSTAGNKSSRSTTAAKAITRRTAQAIDTLPTRVVEHNRVPPRPRKLPLGILHGLGNGSPGYAILSTTREKRKTVLTDQHPSDFRNNVTPVETVTPKPKKSVASTVKPKPAAIAEPVQRTNTAHPSNTKAPKKKVVSGGRI